MKRLLLKWLVVLLVLGLMGTLLIPRLLPRDVPPPDVSDLMYDYPVVPDEENAYPLFIDAAGHLNLPDDFHLIQQQVRNNEEMDAEAITQLLEENPQVFALIEQGLERARCLPPEMRRYDGVVPYSGDWMRMSQLLEIKGHWHLHQGRREEAATACMTLLRFGDMIQRDSYELIDHVVASNLLDVGLNIARIIATDAATPRDAREALRRVLDDIGPFDDTLARSCMAEYQKLHHLVDDVSTDMRTRGKTELLAWIGMDAPPFFLPPGYVFHPNRTRQMVADYYRAMRSNLGKIFAELGPEDYELVADDLESGPWRRLFRPNAVGLILFSRLMAPLSNVIHRKIHLECDLAATRLLFACIAYREDQGHNPATLDALVPDYIAAVPIDPYDGQPFRYDAARGRLYAVGPNLTDFGGLASTQKEHQPIFMHADKDIVYEIGGLAKPAVPE